MRRAELRDARSPQDSSATCRGNLVSENLGMEPGRGREQMTPSKLLDSALPEAFSVRQMLYFTLFLQPACVSSLALPSERGLAAGPAQAAGDRLGVENPAGEVSEALVGLSGGSVSCRTDSAGCEPGSGTVVGKVCVVDQHRAEGAKEMG